MLHSKTKAAALRLSGEKAAQRSQSVWPQIPQRGAPVINGPNPFHIAINCRTCYDYLVLPRPKVSNPSCTKAWTFHKSMTRHDKLHKTRPGRPIHRSSKQLGTIMRELDTEDLCVTMDRREKDCIKSYIKSSQFIILLSISDFMGILATPTKTSRTARKPE